MATNNMTDPNLLGVRDTLKNKYNVSDERIGYDGEYVTIDGQRTIKPVKNVDGSTFADQATFNSAAGNITNLNNQHQLMQKVLGGVGMSGQGTATVNPMDQQITDILSQLSGRITSPQEIDMRDVYRSPMYDAQEAQIQRQAHQATRAAQEALGDSGFGRSTRLTDRAQGIQNDANAYLETQVVPMIMQQMQADQDRQTAALMDLVGVLGQERSFQDTRSNNEFNRAMELLGFQTDQTNRAEDVRFRNDEFAYRQERDQVSDQQLADEKAYRSQRDSEEDRRWWANYEREGQQFAQQMGYNWAQLSQRDKEFLADEAYRQKQLGLQERELDVREAQETPASAGIDQYDLMTVESLAQEQGVNVKRADDREIRMFVAGLKSQYGWTTDEAAAVERHLQGLREQETQRSEQAAQEEQARREQGARNVQEFYENAIQDPRFRMR